MIINKLFSRLEWRTSWLFGFAHAGRDRYFRIGKLAVRLSEERK